MHIVHLPQSNPPPTPYFLFGYWFNVIIAHKSIQLSFIGHLRLSNHFRHFQKCGHLCASAVNRTRGPSTLVATMDFTDRKSVV